jgi:hypothetical protein
MSGNVLLNPEKIVQLKTKLTDWGLLDPNFSRTNPDKKIEHTENFHQYVVSSVEIIQNINGLSVDGLIDESECDYILSIGSPPALKPDTTLEKRIIDAYTKNDWYIARGANAINILFLRNVDREFNSIPPKIDSWNDACILWNAEINGIIRVIEPYFSITIDPGKYYTDRPLNINGAARIADGQYKAWTRGLHGSGRTAHMGFRQDSPINVLRDVDKDGKVSSKDFLNSGVFYCNWHTTGKRSQKIFSANVGKWSAGCTVWQYTSQFDDFTDKLLQDYRFKISPAYTYIGAYLDGKDF